MDFEGLWDCRLFLVFISSIPQREETMLIRFLECFQNFQISAVRQSTHQFFVRISYYRASKVACFSRIQCFSSYLFLSQFWYFRRSSQFSLRYLWQCQQCLGMDSAQSQQFWAYSALLEILLSLTSEAVMLGAIMLFPIDPFNCCISLVRAYNYLVWFWYCICRDWFTSFKISPSFDFLALASMMSLIEARATFNCSISLLCSPICFSRTRFFCLSAFISCFCCCATF